MLNLCRSSKLRMCQRHNLWLLTHWLGFEQATYDKCILSFEVVRIINQDFTSHPCSSENLGVVEADVGSCKQLNLLTRIRPCKKLKVNAEDLKRHPKAFEEKYKFLKCYIRSHCESMKKKKKDPGLPYRTMVNTSPYNDGGAGSIRGLVAKICMPCGQKKTNKQTNKETGAIL